MQHPMATYTVYRARDLRDGAHKTTLRPTVSSLAISHLLSIQYRLKDTRHTACHLMLSHRAHDSAARSTQPAPSSPLQSTQYLWTQRRTHHTACQLTYGNVWHTAHTMHDERGNATAACVIKWMNRHTPHGMRTHMCGTPRTICDQRHTYGQLAHKVDLNKDTRHTPHGMPT